MKKNLWPEKKRQEWDERKKRRLILRRIGVTEEDLQTVAPITKILNKSRGGMEVVFSAMRLSTNPVIVGFLEKYYGYTEKERSKVPMEAFALSFEMDPDELLAEILIALREYSVSVVKVLAITAHPDVVEKQIEYAMQAAGEKDRHAINTAMGFTPSPKGPTFITRVSVGADGKKEITEGEIEPEEVDLDFLFPTLSETQKRIPGQVPPARRIGARETNKEE